ncbi:MAG: hypothetical protein QWI36_00240 [Wolbachia endosymbiont of Tyrophagus putrescentiae]|nr:hypothetical protein [Wolbachia endosymbiont of Tyrophagus putrescentiae]
MLKTLENGIVNFTMGLKGLFSSSKSEVYVEDLREPVICNSDKYGRLLCYPKNYDKVVDSGVIQQAKDSLGKIIKGEYDLLYGNKDKEGKQTLFRLRLVTEDEKSGKSYFTISYLIEPKHNQYEAYYKPFGFTKSDLKKYLPVFEAEKQDGSYKLSNSSMLTKMVKDKNKEVQEICDEKGRNGHVLYTSDYKSLNNHFSEIRDKHGNLELSTSLISVPIILTGALAKIAVKVLTFLPQRLGEYLVGKQNQVAKAVGYCLFIPAVTVKNLVNMGTVILRSPILWLTRSRKDFGSMYSTMLESQWNECKKEAKNDFEFVKNGKRERVSNETEKEEKQFFGTWKELNCIRKQEKVEEEKKAENKSLAPSEQLKVIEKNSVSNKPNEFAEKLRESRQGNTTGCSSPTL